MILVASIIGWTGAIVLLVAYGLVATHRLSANTMTYHVLNLGGAIALTLYGLAIGAWPNVVLNSFWAIVGVVGIVVATRAVIGMRRIQDAAGDPPLDSPSA